jgi:hypothetical protein
MTQIEEWLDEDDSAGYVRLPSKLFQLLSQTDPERTAG